MKQILNIAGYKFIELSGLPELQVSLLDRANALQLKGTILLSQEGINISLAGEPADIMMFVTELKKDSRLESMTFRESFSTDQPFDDMKVKIKKEIITFRQPEIHPEQQAAPAISPQEFKQWLDENRDITVLDTRNDYEVRFGTFHNAVNLCLKEFSEFPEAAKKITRDKPVVMFCTGGIRCEKAALAMLSDGHPEVYQLEGGILNYFAETGGAHYDGECFVFDQRIAVDVNLQTTGTMQCRTCQGPIRRSDASCSACINYLT